MVYKYKRNLHGGKTTMLYINLSGPQMPKGGFPLTLFLPWIASEIFLRTRTSHVTRKFFCLFRSDPTWVKVESCLTFSKAFHWKSVGT